MNRSASSTQQVLVDAAHTMGSIAVIRSLGRAGHAVHACSQHHDALGFKSRYTNKSAVSPDYESPQFLDFLREYIVDNAISVVIPSEGFLLAIRASFSEFSHLLPFSSDESVVYKGLSKWDLFDQLRRSGTDDHLPPYQLLDFVDGEQQLQLDEQQYFLKLDEVYRNKEGQHFPGVLPAQDAEQYSQLIGKVRPFFDRALVQGFVSGVGCGAFFLVWDGIVVAYFMHLRLHEVPHTGGASSLRKSWWHQAIYDDALEKVTSLQWQGVVMVEYRWNPESDEFYLMEMNCRFWGSLHLALYAGVDFPALLVACHAGHAPPSLVKPSPNELACRYTFPREVQFVWSLWKDARVPGREKLGAAIRFCGLFFSKRTKSDLWFPGDRFLYWRRFYRFIRDKGA